VSAPRSARHTLQHPSARLRRDRPAHETGRLPPVHGRTHPGTAPRDAGRGMVWAWWAASRHSLDAVARARIQPDPTQTGGRGVGSVAGARRRVSAAQATPSDHPKRRRNGVIAVRTVKEITMPAAMPIPEGIDAHDRQGPLRGPQGRDLVAAHPGRCRSCLRELAGQVQQSLVVALDVVAVGFFRHASEVRPLDQGGLVDEQLASLRDARLYEDLG
jgi:hypothetical protein